MVQNFKEKLPHLNQFWTQRSLTKYKDYVNKWSSGKWKLGFVYLKNKYISKIMNKDYDIMILFDYLDQSSPPLTVHGLISKPFFQF